MDRESLVRVKATLDIDLHPSKLSDVHAGVQDHLNSMLLRYDNTLGGAVLAYTNDRLLGHQTDRFNGWSRAGEAAARGIWQAPVHPYFSYVRVRVKTDLLLFKPKAKQTMVGRVTKTGHDFVSLLVMGVFNAVIPAEQMSRRFRRSDVGNSWKRKTGAAGEEIVVGTHVRFVVMRVKNNGGYFSIHGSLAEKGTGVVLAAEAGEQQLPGSCSPGTAANPEPAAAAVRDREDGVTEGQRHLQAKAHANNGGTTEADQQAADVVPPKTKKRKKLAAAEARDGKRKKAARKASLDSVGRL